MRDYNNKRLQKDEYKDELQNVVNEIIELLLYAKNVKKFRMLDEVLSIINRLVDEGVLEKDKMPSIEIPCIGILWNSLNEDLMAEAIGFIQERATITGATPINLEDKYREFIYEIYDDNTEFEGIPFIKASTLIDKFDSNTIVILNMVVRVTNYIYFNKLKGFMFKEIAELKTFIRKYFKQRITDYAYDNIFHLTVDDGEYQRTAGICRKYVKQKHEINANQEETD